MPAYYSTSLLEKMHFAKILKRMVLILVITIAIFSLVYIVNYKTSLLSEREKEIEIIAAKLEKDNLVSPEIPFIEDPKNNFGVNYDYPPIEQRTGTVRVPVLNYHHVAPLPKSGSARDYYVSPEMFEAQMTYLQRKNYKVLSMQEFYDLLKTGENPSQKSVLITFDDGYGDNYDYAFPVLKKYGFVATFFVVSGSSGMTSSELREMAAAGMDIGSHSKTHTDLATLDDEGQLSDEILKSKLTLQYMSGSSVSAISYPGCTADSETLKHVGSAGYLLAFTCGRGIDHRFGAHYVLQRVHIYSNMENFKQRLSGIVEYTSSYE